MNLASRPALLLGASALALCAGQAWGQPLPTGGSVVAGSAAVATEGRTMTIRQGTDRAAMNWETFSIGADHRVTIQQPRSASVSVHNVTGRSPSRIFGQLDSNGRVVLANPDGVHIGPNARVSAAGFIAAAGRVTDQSARDFVAGAALTLSAANPGAEVVNEGTITVAQGGLAALVGPGVRNSGVIDAKLGSIVLAGARTATVDFAGDGLISFAVAPGAVSVENTGALLADGGGVRITAATAEGIADGVLKIDGTIRANRMVAGGRGEVIIDGGPASRVTIAGRVAADGAGPGIAGGTVRVRGRDIAVASTARVSADGQGGGGRVTIGGEVKGGGGTAANPAPDAARTVSVERGALITASATGTGPGITAGTIVLWSEGETTFQGRAEALGGGGFVETSSRGVLSLSGSIDVPGGEWLIDPINVTIVAGANNGVLTGGSINDGSINAALNTGTTVTITTAGAGADPGNLTLTKTAAINLTAAVTSTLKLTADNNIALQGSIKSTAGTLNLDAVAGKALTTSGVINVSGAVSLQAVGGAATINNSVEAGGSLKIQGTSVTISNPTTTNMLVRSGTDQDLTVRATGAGGFLKLTSTSTISNLQVIARGTGTLTLETLNGGAVSILGGNSASGGVWVRAASELGNVVIMGGGLTVKGGPLGNSFARVDAGGTLTVSVSGDILVQGGGAGTKSLPGNTFLQAAKGMTVNADGAISVIGGTSGFAPALITNLSGTQTIKAGGQITVATGVLTNKAGDAINGSSASITNAGGTQTIVSTNGGITISASSNAGGAVSATVAVTKGDQVIQSALDVVVSSVGTDANATARLAAETGTQTIQIGRGAGRLTIQGGEGAGGTAIVFAAGRQTISAQGVEVLGGNTGLNASASLISLSTQAIDVDRIFTVNGGLATGANAIVSAVGGQTILAGAEVVVQGGVATGSVSNVGGDQSITGEAVQVLGIEGGGSILNQDGAQTVVATGFSVTVRGDLSLGAGPATIAVVNGSQTVRAAQQILLGDVSAVGTSSITASGGTQTVVSGTNPASLGAGLAGIIVNGGIGAGASAIISNTGTGQTIAAAGNLLLQGGTGTDAVAAIRNAAGPQSVAAGTTMELLGGGAAGAAAEIVNAAGAQAISAASLRVAADLGLARIETIGGLQTVLVTGDVLVRAGLVAGGAAATIRNGGGAQDVRGGTVTIEAGLADTANASVWAVAGDQLVYASAGDLSILGPGGAPLGTTGGRAFIRLGDESLPPGYNLNAFVQRVKAAGAVILDGRQGLAAPAGGEPFQPPRPGPVGLLSATIDGGRTSNGFREVPNGGSNFPIQDIGGDLGETGWNLSRTLDWTDIATVPRLASPAPELATADLFANGRIVMRANSRIIPPGYAFIDAPVVPPEPPVVPPVVPPPVVPPIDPPLPIVFPQTAAVFTLSLLTQQPQIAPVPLRVDVSALPLAGQVGFPDNVVIPAEISGGNEYLDPPAVVIVNTESQLLLPPRSF